MENQFHTIQEKLSNTSPHIAAHGKQPACKGMIPRAKEHDSPIADHHPHTQAIDPPFLEFHPEHSYRTFPSFQAGRAIVPGILRSRAYSSGDNTTISLANPSPLSDLSIATIIPRRLPVIGQTTRMSTSLRASASRRACDPKRITF